MSALRKHSVRLRLGLADRCRSVDGPERHGILVFDEYALARHDGLSIRRCVSNFDSGQFRVLLVARLVRDELGTGCQGQQDRAGVDNRAISTTSTTTPSSTATAAASRVCRSCRSGPGGLTILDVDAKEFIAFGKADRESTHLNS